MRPLIISIFILCASVFAQDRNPNDWPVYLGDKASNQYSPLTQIDLSNVQSLEKVWEYRSEDGKQLGQIQCNPLIIDGILYGASPRLKAFALDAATGEERWKFDPMKGRSGSGVVRGLMYWADGSDKRILYSAQHYLYALDAETGKPIESFGDGGRVDLKDGLGRDVSSLHVGSNTPGVVYEDLVIMGTRVNEAHPAAPGHVRAYNIRSGEQVWIFHTVPQPGELGQDTWPEGAWENFGGANSWAGLSVDVERGMVFVPTGSAAFDFYGADRTGDNLFANCLIALDAKTGERIWHYQFVHHDLWDRDLPAPPNLLTVTHDGKRIDAVAQITKSAHVFLFNRETGESLFPIKEIDVPASDLPGEIASKTQPVPIKPPVFTRESFTLENVTNISPESHEFVADRLKRYKTGRQFIPPSREGTVIFPGFDGGGEWGGAAVDPESGILYVNGSDMPWVLTMVALQGDKETGNIAAGRRNYARHCLYCHGVDRKGDSLGEYPSLLELKERSNRKQVTDIIQKGSEGMPSFEHLKGGQLDNLIEFLMQDDVPVAANKPNDEGEAITLVSTGYNRFVDQDGYPAIRPPWGTLNAINLNSGEILWKSVLGEYPELTARGIPKTGTENYGGPALTASGIIFIAATQDHTIRAFDAKTGAELWAGDLPAGGYATPSVYAVNGRQYVVVAAGGGKMGTESGDSYVAFALPGSL
ncbi:MAG: PQQ-binding-like beta-propeller repeat protein [Candidatus Hydrogenedentota bacterium]